VEPKTEHNQPEHLARRDALRRLAGAVLAAYVVPEVLFLSEANAGNSTPSSPDPQTPAPSKPAPAPSSTNTNDDDHDDGDDDDDHDDGDGDNDDSHVIGPSDAAEAARDTCNILGTQRANTISISRSDMQRSQEAIEAGYAQPLNQIWGNFISGYDGKVIGVEFLDRQNNTRYRFRAISKSGRLETVTISAQTGAIQQIVGCG